MFCLCLLFPDITDFPGSCNISKVSYLSSYLTEQKYNLPSDGRHVCRHVTCICLSDSKDSFRQTCFTFCSQKRGSKAKQPFAPMSDRRKAVRAPRSGKISACSSCFGCVGVAASLWLIESIGHLAPRKFRIILVKVSKKTWGVASSELPTTLLRWKP